MAAINIQDPVFSGANTLVYYKSVTKTLVKTSCIYYKGLAERINQKWNFTDWNR